LNVNFVSQIRALSLSQKKEREEDEEAVHGRSEGNLLIVLD